MPKKKLSQDDLKQMRKSVILLHGHFEKDFYTLFNEARDNPIFVMEGRPSLEASQQTCSQLNKLGITPTLISDNMAGFLFYKEMVKEVWLAYAEADRRGAFCYIGASILGILAKQHQVPVFCYPALKRKKRKTKGKSLEKLVDQDLVAKAKDIIYFKGQRIAPKGTEAYVPLMEWVPGACFLPKPDNNKDKK